MKKRDAGQEKREESRSTKKMVETANRQEFEDTEEIVQLRSILPKKVLKGYGRSSAAHWRRTFLERCKVEEAKMGAYQKTE